MLLLQDHRLWLLLLLAGLSLVVRLMQPLPWASLSIFPPLIIIAGVVVPTLLGDVQLALWTGWCLLLFFHVPAVIANIRTTKAIADLDSESLLSWARLFPWLNWGMPGFFWLDIYTAYAFFIEQKADQAYALIDKWQNYRKLPKQLQAVPQSYKIAGQVMLWQWSEAAATYESLLTQQISINPSTRFQAARAYLELAQYEKASACIEQAHLDEIIYPLSAMSLNLLPYFALTGAASEFERTLRVMDSVNARAPELTIDLWRARLAIAQGNLAEGKLLLEKALPEARHPLQIKRIKNLLAPLEAAGTVSDMPPQMDLSGDQKQSEKGAVQDIWRLFKRAAFIQEILAPKRKSLCVNLISFVCLAVFLLSDSFWLPFGLESPLRLVPSMFGADYKTVVKDGQYWRLLTYLFYHGSILHVASNIYALYIFGRITENLFGSARFLGIFFVGGILSGVVHVFMSADMAVGASGAIQAIFAACAVAILKLKQFLPPALRSRYLGFMLGMTVFQIILDQLIPFIAVFAHLGGLAAGLALGAITAVRDPRRLDIFDSEVDGTQKFI